MKNLKQYIQEKLIVNSPSWVSEKLMINKQYDPYQYHPTSWNELIRIIKDRYEELGPGTEQEPIDFNNIDVSGMTTFYNSNSGGIFQYSKFEYIDISEWDVSKVENMSCMFRGCVNLKSIGDISNWDVSNVENMSRIFYNCENLTSVGDLSNWDVSKVKNMNGMFASCKNLENIGDIKNWKVSKVENTRYMFGWCDNLKSVGDLSNWDISNVKEMEDMFYNSGITNKPDWYEE